MTIEVDNSPVDLAEDIPQILIDRAKVRKAQEFYEASGARELVDQLRSENTSQPLLITPTIHPAEVGEIIRRLPDLGSTYFDVYAKAIGKTRAAPYPDYEDTLCGSVIIQATSEGDIRLHGRQMSVITRQAWSADPDALKVGLDIALNNPREFNQSRYCPKINPVPGSNGKVHPGN